MSAEEYADYQERKGNSFVGIGITIIAREDGAGFDITEVIPGGPAGEGGILPGDILAEVEGNDTSKLTMDEVTDLVRGEVNTEVTVAVTRKGEKLSFTLKRQEIREDVAVGQLISGDVGLIKIYNFNSNCADEAVAAVEALIEQGAKSLIFDVRNNPGGYVNEMVELLDYLLPEGVVYRDMNYLGQKGERKSDASCVEMPMAVLVNGNSYSAAEFFAAALREYEWATVVGTKTTGKGYYQTTLRLLDGSAVNLSTGKYFTPNGISLAEVGGLTPDLIEEVDKETEGLIASEMIEPDQDPQIQAALKELKKNNG